MVKLGKLGAKSISIEEEARLNLRKTPSDTQSLTAGR